MSAKPIQCISAFKPKLYENVNNFYENLVFLSRPFNMQKNAAQITEVLAVVSTRQVLDLSRNNLFGYCSAVCDHACKNALSK